MIKRKLGIVCDCIKDESPLITLERIKAIGFDCFFSGAYTDSNVKALKEKSDSLGLEYEFIHAPFKNINSMWLEGDEYKEIYNKMITAITSAANHGIKTVVIHLSSSFTPPEICDLGLKRFDDIINYAISKNVVLAIENLRVVGNVAYFTDKYRNCENVRFCFDCGHEHCYTKEIKWLDIFGNKTHVTHIHDNVGIEKRYTGNHDLHLLPFDGDYNYERMMRQLDYYEYTGTLMLEVFNERHPDYLKMSADEFISTAYKRILKISKM